MLIYRLCKERYSATVLSGSGGLLADGRWHTQGRAIVYCATSESLAVLELRVHVGNYLPREVFVMHEIEIKDALIQSLSATQLPDGWNAVPHSSISQAIGDDWLMQNSSAGLRVPSIHSSTEFNVLLNPQHPQIHNASVQRQWQYRFDARMFVVAPVRSPPTRSKRKV